MLQVLYLTVVDRDHHLHFLHVRQEHPHLLHLGGYPRHHRRGPQLTIAQDLLHLLQLGVLAVVEYLLQELLDGVLPLLNGLGLESRNDGFLGQEQPIKLHALVDHEVLHFKQILKAWVDG